MGCSQQDLIECSTVQIIEPNTDFLIDTAGTTSDLEERGDLALLPGQTHAEIYFQVPKLNNNFHFEYLYVDAQGIPNAGTVQIIPTIRATIGFQVLFAGSPIQTGYVLHWRVVITTPSILVEIDAPERLYLQMPHDIIMQVPFVNPRSGSSYGFSELRVENLIDVPGAQAIIRIQVVAKTTIGFTLAVNPRPPNTHYFLVARTP